MLFSLQLLLAIFCTLWSQNGIPSVTALPPPWKFMMPMLAPPPGSPAAGPVDGATAPGAAGPAAGPAAGIASPFPFGYPGLWSPFFGVPPPLSYLSSAYALAPSNETDAAIAAYLTAKAEEKKAKASKKLLKETTAAAAAAGTTVPEITQLAALLTKLLQTTTTTTSPPSSEEIEVATTPADIPMAPKTTATPSLAQILKDLLQ